MGGNFITKLAREECANFSHVNTQCSGLTVFNHLFREPGECWIIKNKPCEYFRECVLPMTKKTGDWDKASDLYFATDVTFKPKGGRTCPNCGKTLAPKKRLCPDCLKKKQKMDRKKRIARFRSKKQRLSVTH